MIVERRASGEQAATPDFSPAWRLFAICLLFLPCVRIVCDLFASYVHSAAYLYILPRQVKPAEFLVALPRGNGGTKKGLDAPGRIGPRGSVAQLFQREPDS
jgi:hypothetical protein